MTPSNLKLNHHAINPFKKTKIVSFSISILLLLSMITAIGVFTVQAATTFTFGNTSVGDSTNWFARDRDGTRFQLTQTGTLQSISTYFKTSGFTSKAAIYKDNNDSPSTLIAQSSALTVQATGWKTFAMPQTTLTPGYYWLCIVSSSSQAMGAGALSSNSHVWKTDTYYSDYPSTFGTPNGKEKATTSIYATLVSETSQPPPTTPPPTPTQIPTPVPTIAPTAAPTTAPTQTPAPTTAPTPTVKPTAIPTIRPTSTPIPTPVPTASPVSSGKANAIWLEHMDYEFVGNNPQSIVQKLVAGDIDMVFVQVGNWRQSGSTVSINHWFTSQDISQTINAIKTYSNNQIEVHAWVVWNNQEKVNLGDSSIRSKAVTTAVNLVKTYGFDGINDDLYEGYTGTDSDYVSFANALGNAMSAISKKSSVCLYSGYTTNKAVLYGGITQVNYVVPMLYDGEPWYPNWITDCLKGVIDHSRVQILAGLMAKDGRGVTLSSQLNCVGHPTDSKFAGISLWSLAHMDSQDWTAWNNWT